MARAKRSQPPKLVLCVIDAMAPEMLERTVAAGAAPVLRTLIERGRYVPDCVAAFPSVTPVCAASIVTGVAQDAHHVPGMNWFHRGERRYVEYGSSFRSAQRFGIGRQLTDTVYNLNRAHLSTQTPTVFETLDDAGVRTAGTTYLMYRGRHRHEPQRDTALTRIASALMRHSVMGPRELFYADIFASRQTGCRSGLGMPGVRDRHSGCVSSFLVEHDLFDFLLLSLPDNDWRSHKDGPDAQLQSIAQADLQLARVCEAAGGVDEFLREHAVIVMADHSQAPVTATIALQDELAELGVLGPPRAGAGEDARIAVCPSQRAAMVYALHEAERDAMRASVLALALGIDGVEHALWLARDAHERPSEGILASAEHGELRFGPGGPLADPRDARWSVDGPLAVIGGRVQDGVLLTPSYPDVLARAWSALTCPSSGDVLLSAAPGYEFLDWGRQAHVGGGSHGSLHASDSLGALVTCGVELPSPEPAQWAIRDIAPLVLDHFGLAGGAAA
ncbi:MAG TPA: alkaline phosphatase family protein [Solirubrobacteraceae bacterium]|jgi:predicted AlkP superfamily pyrophosphatase or phosphodiesterase|nr:alkaline phosphatase family protein [Solirubrobacteraceae bacterium]